MSAARNNEEDKISFEDALQKAGFGAYSLSLTLLSGFTIISFASIYFSTTVVVPLSACELRTTSAQQGILVAGPIIGSVIGAMFWGHISDHLGRRNVLRVSLMAGAAVNALASFSPNWVVLLIMQFTAALMVSGQHSMSVSLLSESVPLERRDLVMVLVSSIFLLSQGFIAAIAMPIVPLKFSYYVSHLKITWNSWRTLLLVYSVPSLLSAVWLSYMQESPRFMYSKGEEGKTLDILRVIHRVNNRRSHNEYSVTGLTQHCPHHSEPDPSSNHFMSLFRPPLLKNTVIMTILNLLLQVSGFKLWLPAIAEHFMQVVYSDVGSNLTLCRVIATNMNKRELEDNSLVTATCTLHFSALFIVLITTVIISIVNGFVTLIVNRIGCRNSVILVTLVAGSSAVLVNLVPSAIASGGLFVVFLMGIVTIGLYTALSVALFPTYLRALALTFLMTSSHIANFGTIQIINYLLVNSCEISFYVYGTLFACSAVVASFLPKDSPAHQLRHERLLEATESDDK